MRKIALLAFIVGVGALLGGPAQAAGSSADLMPAKISSAQSASTADQARQDPTKVAPSAVPGIGSLINIDATDAAHVPVCGVNAATHSANQACDNWDRASSAQQSGASNKPFGLINLDLTRAAHLPICGVNVLVSNSDNQQCSNNPQV
ncbi:hypothetical protein Lfu02_41240 [Longispora fulva]|uniref:Secreted protein n=1 Tax=Longispora fulva TaxID=619741 RepID=A0A8J7GHT7_9ACTN|nr:hypothetical protein [Longispora fulva]MBG6136583.1 hypothetical protein [Longispora fulva]GIG59752.1 hypothetical protein Lfu02_41240 [Longispora fulva]